MLTLRMFELDFIPVTPYCPLDPTRIDPECRAGVSL